MRAGQSSRLRVFCYATHDVGGKDSPLHVAKAIADYATSKTGKIDILP
jgi:hypothetical protein